MTLTECYDILNAGPHNRFQANGVIVSNSGAAVQPQNLPRGTGLVPPIDQKAGSGLIQGIADAFPYIMTGDVDMVDFMLGPPHQAISDCIRGFIVPAPGKVLVACDYSAIEAKIIAIEAGQMDIVDVFLRGDDIYKFAAGQIYNVPYNKVTKAQRQVGKVAILALGYQGGVGAFTSMAKLYRVDMADAYDSVLEVTPGDVQEASFETYAENSKAGLIDLSMDKNAYLASDMVKRNWRARNKAIVKFWYDCEQAAMEAACDTDNRSYKVRNLTFVRKGPFLYCRLASGRVIVYPEPRIEKVKTRWGTIKEGLTYTGPMKGKQGVWTRLSAYGGLIVENVTQATAASVLRDGLRNLEAAGYPVVLHIHDEAVVEIPPEQADLKRIEYLMTQMPPWMRAAKWPEGLITAAADGPLTRYRK
jgi:DNA polymerase